MTAVAHVDLASLGDEGQPRGEARWVSAAYVFLRSRKLLMSTTLLGGMIGLGGGLMRPNSYTSTGTLLLRSGTRETDSAEAAVAGRSPSPSARPFDLIANEIEILSHRETFRKVVETVGAARILRAYDPAAEDDALTPLPIRELHRLQSWWFASEWGATPAYAAEGGNLRAFKVLAANLVLQAAGSTMIRVSYETHTPELAKQVTDAFLAAAEERHRQVFTNRTSLEFLTTLEEGARKEAGRAHDALLEFKREHKIYDPEVQRGDLLKEITRLQNQIASDSESLQAQKSRCGSLREKLKSEEALQDVASESPPIANPEYASLQSQVFSLRSQKLALESATLDKVELRRRAEALDELIATTERRLQGVPQVIPGASIRQAVKNPRYEWLRSHLDDAELSIVTLEASADARKATLGQLKDRLETLERLASRHAGLSAQAARHDSDNKRFVENLRNTELLNLLDQHKLSNLQILEAGDVPMSKTGPNRTRWLLTGAMLGLVSGLCLAFARQRLEGAIRRAPDLLPLGLEPIAVVSETSAAVAQGLSQRGGLGDDTAGPLRRELNSLWTALVPAWTSRESRTTIALVGDGGAPGVTTLALCLAARSARYLHLDVLLVETNYHHPTLAARMGLGKVPGLAELLAGVASRDEVVRPTGIPSLRVVHAGSGASLAGVKIGERPDELLRSLGAGFHTVLLDIPSIVEHPEFGPLANQAERVVLVLAAGRSTQDSVRGLRETIKPGAGGAPEAILNRWRSVRPVWMPRSIPL